MKLNQILCLILLLCKLFTFECQIFRLDFKSIAKIAKKHATKKQVKPKHKLKTKYGQTALALALTHVGLGVKENLKTIALAIETNCDSDKLLHKWLNMFMKLRFLFYFKNNEKTARGLFTKKTQYFKQNHVVKELLKDFADCSYNKREEKGKIIKTLSFRKRKLIADAIKKSINKVDYIHPKIIKRFLDYNITLFFKNHKLKTFIKSNEKYLHESFPLRFSRYFTNFIKFMERFQSLS